MPAKVIEPAPRHYKVDNDWLEEYATDPSRYVDIEEIRAGTSQYVTDLIAMGKAVNVIDEQQKANFWIQSLYIGSVASGQDSNIKGRLVEDSFDDTWPVSTPGFLQAKMSRIYPAGTDVRDIKFMGYQENA